jgi:phosphatidylglycerophosphatase A
MASRSLPRGLGFWHPVCLISTCFGLGLLPGAPGTYASFAALPLAWTVLHHWGSGGLLAVGVAVFLIGLWTATIYVRRTRERDPQPVVIDEVAAQLLVLSAAPLDWPYFLLGCVLFRLADILKPWPASWADQRLHGGIGVMLDDLLAAPYAWATLYGIVLLLKTT